MPVYERSGFSQHFIDEGVGDPLVFLHGFPLDHSMWDHQRRYFAEHFRVIIPDLRGFGRSGSSGEVTTMAEFADDLASLLDELLISKPITLCGLSMGGYIAFEFIRRHAARVERLVLCDTKAVGDTPEAAEDRLKLATKVISEGPRVVADAMLPKLFSRDTSEHRPAIVDKARNLILAGSVRGIAAAQRGMAVRADSTPLLAEISCPTLILVGDRDQISPPAEMEAIAAQIPGGVFAVIPQAGHLSPLENPTTFNKVLGEWLNPIPHT